MIVCVCSSSQRLVNGSVLLAAEEAMELGTYQRLVMKEIETTKVILQRK